MRSTATALAGLARLLALLALGAAVVAVATLSPLGQMGGLSAQGVAVFTGSVTIDGQAAPRGTTVQVRLLDGTVLGTAPTGTTGLSAEQYRIDVQARPSLENQAVEVVAPGTHPIVQATTVFSANRVHTVNLSVSNALPAPTPTSQPAPAPSPGPTSTPVLAAPTMTPAPATITPASVAVGITVYTGHVSIDGQPAPAFTVVQVLLEDGTVLGTGATGTNGLAASQYRIDVQAHATWANRAVQFQVRQHEVTDPVTVTFAAGHIFAVDLLATTLPPPTPTPTATATTVGPVPQPTITADAGGGPPGADATGVPAPSTPGPATALPESLVVSGESPSQAEAAASSPEAIPSATPASVTPGPAAIAPGTAGGGGCNGAAVRGGPADIGWMVLGLVAPGLALRRLRGKR